MENLAAYMLLVRGILAAILAAGGLYALNRGFRLFVIGVGEKKDDASVEFGRFKASSKSVGSFVMITACVWGLLGYLTVPVLETEVGRVKVSTKSDWDRDPAIFLAQSEAYGQLFGSIDAWPHNANLLLP